jgi:Ras-related protein Rab-18
MERWYEEAESNAMPGAVMYLVGSKLDKASSRAVKVEEGERLAQQHGSQFCEVSSKMGNVAKPFVEIVDAIVKNPLLLNASKRPTGTVSIGGQNEGLGGICSC